MNQQQIEEGFDRVRKNFHKETGIVLDSLLANTLDLAQSMENAPDRAIVELAGGEGPGGNGLAIVEAWARAARLQAQAAELLRDILAKRHADIVRGMRGRCGRPGDSDTPPTP